MKPLYVTLSDYTVIKMTATLKSDGSIRLYAHDQTNTPILMATLLPEEAENLLEAMLKQRGLKTHA